MAEAMELVQRLRSSAKRVGANAHAPHSGFRVGAAVLDSEDRVHVGCNVESDSYGLTQCAERNALGAAIAAGVRRGRVEAVVIHVPGPVPLPPCGACRQVMVELLAPGARIISCCDGDEILHWRRETLMPEPFTLD